MVLVKDMWRNIALLPVKELINFIYFCLSVCCVMCVNVCVIVLIYFEGKKLSPFVIN